MSEHLLSEADFHERLVQFFGPFVSVRPVDWACVRESVTHFDPLFKFEEFSNLYFEYVFGLFEDFRITDRAAICLYFTGYIRFKLYCTFKLLYPEAIYPAVPKSYENYFTTESPKLDKLPSRTILFYTPSVARRILCYMAPLITECKDLFYVANFISGWIGNDRFVLDHPDTFHWESVGVRGRRLQLIVMAVYFVMHVVFDKCRGSIEGFRLLFQVIPDPHVTLQEISGFLTPLFSGRERLKHLFIESFQKSCEECLPKCVRVLEPRSLKHLARCEVRRCLSDAHNLPHGVWSLGLPRELEDYVLLLRPKDQYRPVTIPPLSRMRVFAVPNIQSQETLDLGRIFRPKRRRASAFSSSSYMRKKAQH